MAKKERTRRRKPSLKVDNAAGRISADVIALGNRRELFVDDYLIERMRDIELRLHEPVPRNVAIDHDAPWEGNTCGYHTVFKDGALYRAYYRARTTRRRAPIIQSYATPKVAMASNGLSRS